MGVPWSRMRQYFGRCIYTRDAWFASLIRPIFPSQQIGCSRHKASTIHSSGIAIGSHSSILLQEQYCIRITLQRSPCRRRISIWVPSYETPSRIHAPNIPISDNLDFSSRDGWMYDPSLSCSWLLSHSLLPTSRLITSRKTCTFSCHESRRTSKTQQVTRGQISVGLLRTQPLSRHNLGYLDPIILLSSHISTFEIWRHKVHVTRITRPQRRKFHHLSTAYLGPKRFCSLSSHTRLLIRSRYASPVGTVSCLDHRLPFH
ncbi:hypothetical protein GGR53DRAFT_283349 [Hypoxylon sp. FL1150]|nr:hypothetical protein GGR53DRAFT_283349 [Hypoxylon sp. FL1150]